MDSGEEFKTAFMALIMVLFFISWIVFAVAALRGAYAWGIINSYESVCTDKEEKKEKDY